MMETLTLSKKSQASTGSWLKSARRHRIVLTATCWAAHVWRKPGGEEAGLSPCVSQAESARVTCCWF